jgi:hypothetical protein
MGSFCAISRLMTVCFGHAGGFLKQSQNGLACFIELIALSEAAFLAAGAAE